MRPSPLKIATFNINGVNRRLSNLLSWLDQARPDVVCLQELKAAQYDFPEKAIRDAGYFAVWQGERNWNGVAILARAREPIATKRELPGDPADKQSRYIEAAVNGILVGCLYLPNGNPQPGPKFDHKLAWLERLITYSATLLAMKVPAVLAGDFNVVPTDADMRPSRSMANNALVQPPSRAAYHRLLDLGWTDAIRTHHPNQPMFTFWGYLHDRWKRDSGLRIDHLLPKPGCDRSVVRCWSRPIRARRAKRQRSCSRLDHARQFGRTRGRKKSAPISR